MARACTLSDADMDEIFRELFSEPRKRRNLDSKLPAVLADVVRSMAKDMSCAYGGKLHEEHKKSFAKCLRLIGRYPCATHETLMPAVGPQHALTRSTIYLMNGVKWDLERNRAMIWQKPKAKALGFKPVFTLRDRCAKDGPIHDGKTGAKHYWY